MSLLKVSVGTAGRLKIEVASGGLNLSAEQVRALYALAESDWGWLAVEDLRTRASAEGRKLPGAQIEALLSNLEQAELVHWHTSAAEGLGQAVALTESGLAVITQLTRNWTGWHDYRQRYTVEQY